MTGVDGARLLAGLDAQQRRAVTDPSQPLCIHAGAGSGKTRVLTRRIAHRSCEGTADPRRVLALTFTRKAANEMISRLAALGLRDGPTVGTFHAVAWAQLRTHWTDRGRSVPGLLDRKARVLASLPSRGGLAPAELAAEIEWARARLVTPEGYPAAAHQADRRVGASLEEVGQAYAAFEAEKRRRGVVDFDDILSLCADALEGDAAFAGAQRWRFRHLFVDEFQDVNPLQHRLLEAWRGERADLCVVGDPRQAIYRWNGADASYLTRFTRHHPAATVVELTGNHRSTPQILHLANAVLGPGASPLTAHRPSGAVPGVARYATDRDEATGIAAAARLARRPGTRWDRQAVLVRTNGQMPLIEEALLAARIPVRLRGADPLLQRNAVRDALRDLTNGADRPLRMALADLATMVAEADDDGATQTADDLSSLLRLAQDLDAHDPTAPTSALRRWIVQAVGADGPGRGGDAVDVVTFHAAKGLEWPLVHVAGLEDGYVPISHARTSEAEAEERRLLHVALTRAEDVLRLSWAQLRTLRDREVRRRPSPYLAVLDETVTMLATADRAVPPGDGLARARRALPGTGDHDAPRALLAALAQWRAQVARRAGVPPAVVLSDRMLADVARLAPHDEEGLAAVRGMGSITIDTHGDGLLETIKRHQPRGADA